jgi:peptidyl-prolyl cis-trans isomerase C
MAIILINGIKENMMKARARHILTRTEKLCLKALKEIQGGAAFGEVAKKYSECPSGQQGGDLGEFSPGQMVLEFDQVVFMKEVGKVHGPVRTQFGYHLIEILSRG